MLKLSLAMVLTSAAEESSKYNTYNCGDPGTVRRTIFAEEETYRTEEALLNADLGSLRTLSNAKTRAHEIFEHSKKICEFNKRRIDCDSD